MLKHYIRWQFRKWLPLVIIFSAVAFSVSSSVALAIPTYYIESELPRSTVASGFFAAPFFVGLVLSVVMSLFVYTYRTRKPAVDIFYQAAYAPTTIKRVRVLLGLAILLISLTAGYLLSFSVYLLRYFSTPLTRTVSIGGETIVYHRMDCMFVYYLYGYLVMVFAIGAQYFVNCFLAGLGDYVIDQVFLVIFGNILLGALIAAPALYIAMLGRIDNPDYFYSLLYGLGPVGPSSLIVVLTALSGATPNMETALLHSLLATSISFLFGVGCGVINLFLPDPSGESANVKGARNDVIALIPHGAALIISFFVGCLGASAGYLGVYYVFNLLPIFMHIMFAAIYYALLSLWRRSFGRSKTDLIAYLCVTGTSLLLIVGNMIAQATYIS